MTSNYDVVNRSNKVGTNSSSINDVDDEVIDIEAVDIGAKSSCDDDIDLKAVEANLPGIFGKLPAYKKTAYFIFFIVSVWFMVVSARHNEVQEVSFDNNSQELNSDEKIYQKESKPAMKSELGPEDQRKLEPSRSVRDQIF